VFDGADLYVVFGEYGASLGVGYVFGENVEGRFAVQVGASDFIAVIFGGRMEGDLDFQSGVQSNALEGKAFL
jgi:hypothetical protein